MKTAVLFVFVLGALAAAGKVFVTKPGSTVTLDCGLSRYSSKVEWHRESNLLCSVDKTMRVPRKASGDSELAKRSSMARETHLRISGVKEEDAGKFTVVIDGTTHHVTLVVVSVSASPSTDVQLGSEVTLRCQVRGLDSVPLVQWVRPDGTQTGSEVQLKSVARSDGGTWTCKFTHDDVTHTETLEIKVQEPPTTAPPARDPSQKKDSPKTNCTGLHCAPPKSPPTAGQLLGLSWWMWVIVGVGSLVVVLLLVVVVCLYKRIKRKKRKLQKLKNSRLPPLTTKPYCQCDRPTAAAKPQQGRRREKPSAPPLQPLLIE